MIDAIGRQRVPRRTGVDLFLLAAHRRLATLGSRFDCAGFADAVRDVIDDVEARDARFLERVRCDRIGLREDGDQNVSPFDLVLAGGPHVDRGALDDALKTDRRAGRHLDGVGDLGNFGIEESIELSADRIDVAAGVLDDPGAIGVEKQGEQQVLDAHELVPPSFCLARGQTERDLHLGTHSHGHEHPFERKTIFTPARLSP